MPNIRTLNNIEPFNDFMYKDCFFNALFPIVNHFNRSILPFIIDDLVLYTVDSNNHLLNVEFVSNDNFEAVLNRLGIHFYAKISSNDIIQDIISGLNYNQPVIVWIDSFYEPFRLDTYLKVHWSHTLMIYGYDDSEQIFHIIEHKHKDSLLYKKLTISYSDLVKCYQSYVKRFSSRTKNMSFYQFYMDQSTAETKVFSDNMNNDVFIFLENSLKNIHAITSGLNYLKDFMEEYKKIILSEFILEAKAPLLLSNINNIIKFKQFENYRIKKLDQRNLLGLSSLLETINTNWEHIRFSLAKYVFSGIYDRELMQGTLYKMNEIYRIENQYINILQNLHQVVV